MRYLIAAATIVLLAVPAHADRANTLIGSWKYVSTTNAEGASACTTTFIFADKSATITNPKTKVVPQGSTRSMVVSYITASPKLVSVETDGNSVTYNLPDNNHMYTEDPWGRCNYVRTN